ncbi:immunoglobulin-like domain-containing protein [Listeria rustica]|uniref:DUF5011 domain-containing protein n=1 Tax=Listeria rustica TaxID=2713503 RepID=A0A7W1YG45_9LIST|nr:immunoglobulin-like domain-containing protein [Listeria rustica]MBA3926253.1 DUF5011 domain-containing protein [Listeria rustica]
MTIKKISMATAALVMTVSMPMQTYVMATESPQSYSTKAEGILKQTSEDNETIQLINGSFEDPVIAKESDQLDASLVPGWQTTSTSNLIEIQRLYNGLVAADGDQYAELNADQVSALYQDVATTPGKTIRWKVSHRGRGGVDTADVKFGAPGQALELITTMSTDNKAWKEYQGTYTIPEGQTTTRFQFEAISTSDGDATRGNYLDNIVFSTPSVLTVSDTLEQTKIKQGDTTRYNVTLNNAGGMDAGKIQLEIPLPESLGYVPDSVLVDGVATSNVTYNAASHMLQVNLDKLSVGTAPVVSIGIQGLAKTTAAEIKTKVLYEDLGFSDKVYTSSSLGTDLEVTNDAPIITATDKTLKKGDAFDALSGVTASDTEDGNVTSKVSVTANDVDTSKVGTYHVTYSVTDSNGNTTTKTITVTITSNDAPAITATDISVKKGGTFDPMSGVTASDAEDGNVTSSVQVTANDVDTSKVGTYHVTYSVTDSDNNTTTKTITVTVTSNDAPVITATDKTLKKGATFNPLTGVTASDVEDGNITSGIKVTANDVDTSKVGTYHVTYSVTDSDNNTTTKTITVTVTSNDAPVIVASDIVQRIHTTYDVKKAVTANDTEDGDVTSKITVTSNDVNTEKAGVYHVTYSVTDSDNNTTTKTIKVTILTNDAPIITTKDVYLKVGDTFDSLEGITASDLEDGDITGKIEIVSNNVNMKTEGLYEVVYAVTDSDGNTTKATRHIYVRTNDKPEIHVSDQTFKAGFAFDPMSIVSASDLEDGDVTSAIKITANDVNPAVAGTYHITYSVTDSDKNTTTKTVTITVLTNEKPIITVTDRTVKAHLAFDPRLGVSASDLEDGDLSDSVKIIANDVNIDVPGEYHITYSVLDSDGNSAEKTSTITVLSNDNPIITGQDSSFKAGRAFDPMAGITASDTEDGDITAGIQITQNDVNPDVAGVYHVTYSITDSDGNTTEQTYTITVLTNEKPVIHAKDITLAFGQKFDPLVGVTAEDLEDGDITSSIQVISNDVNPNQAGIYHVTYSVIDSDGNETQFTITVIVGAQPILPVDPITPPVAPAKPVTPTKTTTPSVKPAPVVSPIVPIKVGPSAPTKTLPKTGDSNTTSTVLFGGLLAALGAMFLRRRK